jgi:flagellar hook-length control protein FliK
MITPISASAVSALSGDMGSATDLASLQGGEGGGFSGLFAALIAARPDTVISPELPADFLADLADVAVDADAPQMDLTAGNPATENLLAENLAAGILPVENLPVGNPATETPVIEILPTRNPAIENLFAGNLPVVDLPVGNLPDLPDLAAKILPDEDLTGENPLIGNLPVETLPVADLPVGDLPVDTPPVGNLPTGNLPVGNQPAKPLPAGNLPAENLAAVIPEDEDTALLPEAPAHLPAQEKKADDKAQAGNKSKDDDAEENIIALGALSTPVDVKTVHTPIPSSQESADMHKFAGTYRESGLPAQKAVTEEQSPLPKQGTTITDKGLPPPANLAGQSGDHSSGTKEEKPDFAQFLREAGNLTQAKAATTHEAPRMTANLSAPVASNVWGERLGEQIMWMARNGQQQVDLKLNPAHLGPLSISLNMNGDKASIHFTVASLDVRQAVEEALPRLREMMASAGVSLGQAGVDDQARRETAAHAGHRDPKDQNPASQNGEYAENPEESADANGQRDGNTERTSILADMVNKHAMLFAHANGRIGGVDLFA